MTGIFGLVSQWVVLLMCEVDHHRVLVPVEVNEFDSDRIRDPAHQVPREDEHHMKEHRLPGTRNEGAPGDPSVE